MPPPKKKIVKEEKGVKQVVNVRVNLTEAKRKRKQRKPRMKRSTDIAQSGRTGVEYLGEIYPNRPPPPPQFQALPPATFSSFPLLTQQPPQISGLLEDVKRERVNLLEDIQREVKSEAIKQVQKAQGAEQRAELEKIGFQQPVPLTIMEKVEATPNETFEEMRTGAPIIQEPTETNVETSTIGIQEIKRRGRKQGIKNRPKEVIEAEKKAKQEKKSKIPTLNIETQPVIPTSQQKQYNLV